MRDNVIRMIVKGLRRYLKSARRYMKGPSGMIDLSNLFTPGIEDIMCDVHHEKGFKACRSNDEYDKEIGRCFRYYHDSFYLDHTTKDGHFRV